MTSRSRIGIGAGWINTIERCDIPGCTYGIRSIDHHINMLNIIDCDINTCANAAINITHTGENIRISGCTIEGNPGTAIIVQSQVQNLEIVGNYFEANATAGAQFTAPNETLHAYVILNGYGTPGTATTNQPPGAIRVADNFVAMQAVPEPAYFVAAFACYGGLDIINNTINDKDTAAHAKVDTLLLTGTSATGLGARVDNVHMRGNGKSWDPLQSTAALHAITVLDLAGGTSTLHEASIDGTFKGNYAPDLARFAPASRATRATWRTAAASYRRHDVRELGGAAGDGWGFTIDLDDCPELAGKQVYFAVWAQCSDTDTGVALSTSQLGPNTTAHAADTDWHVVSYVDTMPATGAVTFSVAKIDGTSTSTVFIAHPVLSELGVRYSTYE